jgi:hypothetical protein
MLLLGNDDEDSAFFLALWGSAQEHGISYGFKY